MKCLIFKGFLGKLGFSYKVTWKNSWVLRFFVQGLGFLGKLGFFYKVTWKNSWILRFSDQGLGFLEKSELLLYKSLGKILDFLFKPWDSKNKVLNFLISHRESPMKDLKKDSHFWKLLWKVPRFYCSLKV